MAPDFWSAMDKQANLGLATTEELLDELTSRLMDVNHQWRVNRTINMTIVIEIGSQSFDNPRA